MKTEPLKVIVQLKEPISLLPYLALAVNGKSPYDWRYGSTPEESVALLRSKYLDWQNREFDIEIQKL